MRHTKGEWKIIKNHPVIDCMAIMNNENLVFKGSGRLEKPELICEIPHIVGDSFADNIEHIEANANLISAAPDLLEACESAFNYLDIRNLGDTAEMLKKELQKAINKSLRRN